MERNQRELLHVREAADELGVSTVTVRQAIRSGALPAVTLGPTGRYRIRRADLEELLEPVRSKQQ